MLQVGSKIWTGNAFYRSVSRNLDTLNFKGYPFFQRKNKTRDESLELGESLELNTTHGWSYMVCALMFGLISGVCYGTI